jgi:ADP-heptose:LPS heptosyltransferase
MAAASAVVVGNTGPGHLAAAVGVPIVSVFPPTVPAARWRPYAARAVVLGDQGIVCAGCRARRCPVAGQPCLAGVSAEAVRSAVDSLIGRGVSIERDGPVLRQEEVVA